MRDYQDLKDQKSLCKSCAKSFNLGGIRRCKATFAKVVKVDNQKRERLYFKDCDTAANDCDLMAEFIAGWKSENQKAITCQA